ncbi:hypothetical protein Tdes44962_MAKER01679 [Teratosphaeria destructans]|uniref:Uncharacterized protein n=1 Tax=Teratosphaeria destructans TaxID=418781 RepID=A0A9W7SY19_9PEZI|nr:hypothetical protein Tdes44962_MAKER01679 [Teratosphaeria destructans]
MDNTSPACWPATTFHDLASKSNSKACQLSLPFQPEGPAECSKHLEHLLNDTFLALRIHAGTTGNFFRLEFKDLALRHTFALMRLSTLPYEGDLMKLPSIAYNLAQSFIGRYGPDIWFAPEASADTETMVCEQGDKDTVWQDECEQRRQAAELENYFMMLLQLPAVAPKDWLVEKICAAAWASSVHHGPRPRAGTNMDIFANSRLGRLPPELRNCIYEYAFDTVISITPSYSGTGRLIIRHEHCCCRRSVKDSHAIGLTATCRALRAETLELFYHNVTIELCNRIQDGSAQIWPFDHLLHGLDRNPIALRCLAKSVIEVEVSLVREVYTLPCLFAKTVNALARALRVWRLSAIETMQVRATLFYQGVCAEEIKRAELEIDVLDVPCSARKAAKQLQEIDEQEIGCTIAVVP